MRLQTILNRVEKFKSFTYGEARFEERAEGPALVVEVWPRKNSRPSWAGRFLDECTGRTMRTREEPMTRVARMIRTH